MNGNHANWYIVAIIFLKPPFWPIVLCTDSYAEYTGQYGCEENSGFYQKYFV